MKVDRVCDRCKAFLPSVETEDELHKQQVHMHPLNWDLCKLCQFELVKFVEQNRKLVGYGEVSMEWGALWAAGGAGLVAGMFLLVFIKAIAT